MKRCPDCDIEKAADEFYNDKSKSCGLSTRCKACTIGRGRMRYVEKRDEIRAKARAANWPSNQSEYQRAQNKRYYGEIRRIVDEARANPCTDCGTTFHPTCMEFHHRDPGQKEGNVLSMASPRQVRNEMAKCDLVCANCHRLRHFHAHQGADAA